MKNRTVILIFLLMMISCVEREEPEIVTLSESRYLSESNLDTGPEFEDPLTLEELENTLRNRYADLSDKDSTVAASIFEASLYISSDGKPEKIAVIISPHKSISEAFVDYVKQSEFVPGSSGGKQVPSVMRFEFDLSGANDEDEYYLAVDEMPLPKGGIGAIQSKIVYPEIAKRAGIQGRVLVKAYVDETGGVTKAEIIKGIGGGCDQAAMNAIVGTQFIPGVKDGKKVKVQVVIPVLFRLQ